MKSTSNFNTRDPPSNQQSWKLFFKIQISSELFHFLIFEINSPLRRSHKGKFVTITNGFRQHPGGSNLLTELHIRAVIHQTAVAERGTSKTITSVIKLCVLLWFPCVIRVITGQTRANLLQSALRLGERSKSHFCQRAWPGSVTAVLDCPLVLTAGKIFCVRVHHFEL